MESLKFVLEIVRFVVDMPWISIFTPILLIMGTNGLILKTILPFEIVHVAGLGLGTITTVAQVPVPTLPAQIGSVLNKTVTVCDVVDVQPPLVTEY